MDHSDRGELLEQGRAAVRGMRGRDPEAAGHLKRLYPELVRAADAGDPEFQELLGGIFLEYTKDYESARWAFGQAARAGNVAALRGLGFMLFEGLGGAKDADKAVELFQAAAAGGDGAAMFNLGAMYLRGETLPKDRDASIQCFEAASEAGESAASCQLGELMLADGDHGSARRYLELAVDQGSFVALKELAGMCRDGVGGDVDRVRALGCFLKLLDMSDGDGVHEAHQLADHMTADEIREAASWARQAAWGDVLVKRAR